MHRTWFSLLGNVAENTECLGANFLGATFGAAPLIFRGNGPIFRSIWRMAPGKVRTLVRTRKWKWDDTKKWTECLGENCYNSDVGGTVNTLFKAIDKVKPGNTAREEGEVKKNTNNRGSRISSLRMAREPKRFWFIKARKYTSELNTRFIHPIWSYYLRGFRGT